MSTLPGPVDVAIVTGTALACNPRALREATALAAVGHDVVVFGATAEPVARATDQALARSRGFAFHSVVASDRTLAARLCSRVARDVHRALSVESRWQLGPHVGRLLGAAEKARARYYIVHLEQALWVGATLLKSGRRVGIDLEDWYSEDLTPEARRLRPLRMLRDLERLLLAEAMHATCPSRAMSEALAREYGCAPPIVIHNADRWTERKRLDQTVMDRRDTRRPSIHWFSQTMGLGRGLEDLVGALSLIAHDVEIHLRGNLIAGFDRWVRARVPEYWQSRLFFHPTVANHELLPRVAEHDIGFAGEMKYSRSRDLTITNKILQYLLAGVPVVASDTAGQAEVAAQARQAVLLYPSGDVRQLAGCVNALLGSPEKLRAAKAAALQAAERVFCWERQERTLLQAVERALNAGTTAGP